MSLLGPIGPEVTCEECFEHLDEYVEGRDVPGMDAHLEGCPACREDYESLLALVREEDEAPQTEHD
jgi:predicted anti-sigma-YlaC factor YlaD